jgi:NTE family protein
MEAPLLALVLSGGANYGAMQAGALEALFEAGLRPDMIVGTSAGALNGIILAADPTPEGVKRLADLWRNTGPADVGSPNVLRSVRQYVTRQDSLVPNDGLIAFLLKNLPPGALTFVDLSRQRGIRIYTVAVDMATARLRVFGDQEDDRVLDGAMTSTAVPPYFPPWQVQGRRYFDGGILSKLPLLVAIRRGATRLVGLSINDVSAAWGAAHGIVGVSGYAVSILVDHQTRREEAIARMTGAEIRVLSMPVPTSVGVWDYARAEVLVEHGMKLARDWLETDPLRMPPAWWVRMRCRLITRLRGFPKDLVLEEGPVESGDRI